MLKLVKAVFGMLFQIFWKRIIEAHRSECYKFFERREEIGPDFWEEVGKNHSLCECENFSVSMFSPGQIKDDEILVSVVTSKNYITPDGKIEPTLIDQRIKNGISTDRKLHTDLSSYDLRAKKLVEGNANKSVCGSFELLVSRIREIDYEGARAFAVYDTALLENPAHAEIACTEIPPPETPERKKLRAKLRKRVLDSVLNDGRILQSSEIFSTPVS